MYRYKMTQSLLSSWLYQFNAFNEDKAHEDFLKVLRREPTEKTEAMQNGIDFENEVYSCCESGKKSSNDCVNKVADIVRGGIIQLKLENEKSINGMDFLLYGVLDVLKCGIVYDIKYSKTYEVGKYLNSPQHPMYFDLVQGANKFQYIICDGKDVCRETYYRTDTKSIDDAIVQFIEYLKYYGLLDIYKEKWAVK